MNVAELLNGKKEKSIGAIECKPQDLVDTFLRLADFLHMKNPGSIVSTTSKSITIQKKGDSYVLILNNYTPPLEISWSDLFDSNNLEKKLIEASEQSKSVAYLNTAFSNTKIQLALC